MDFQVPAFSTRLPKRFLQIAAAFSLAFLAACMEEKPHTEAPEVTFVDVCKEEYEGKIVAVQGYLQLPDLVLCNGPYSSCNLELNQNSSGDGTSLKIYVLRGSRSGKMDSLPRKYTYADLNFHTADGDVKTGAHVKLIGKAHADSAFMSGTFGIKTCLLEVEYAEKIIATPLPTLSPAPSPILSPTPKRNRKK